MKAKLLCRKLMTVLTLVAALGTSVIADEVVDQSKGYQRLESFGVEGERGEHYYLGMRDGKVGLSEERDPKSEDVFVLYVSESEKSERGVVLKAYFVQKKDGLLKDFGGEKYVTAKGNEIVLTSEEEAGSHWVIRDPVKTELDASERWYSLESVDQPGKFMLHSAHLATLSTQPEMNNVMMADATWKFVHVRSISKETSSGGIATLETSDQ